MENQTPITEFRVVAFSTRADYKWALFTLFFSLYVVGVLMNLTTVTVIYSYHHLHSPLYIFLSSLSIVDIYFTSVTVPKLLHMLLSGNNAVTFTQCLIQMYFFYLACSTEDLILLSMAYDRYAAICHPLHYQQILSIWKCSLFIVGCWVIGSLNALLLTLPTLKMTFCDSNEIFQFFCETKALTKIACAGTDVFYKTIIVEMMPIGLIIFLCTLISYVKILRVILSIKSTEGRKKAFSTCSSHLVVFTMYCGTAASVYLIPSSRHSGFLEEVITVVYAIVTPMLNPLIYSLRNQELRTAMETFFG
ncbi:hypothetical protein GDO81_023902, partial [Engystomops pustulosus]